MSPREEELVKQEWADQVDAEMAWWRTRWFFDQAGVVVVDRPTHGLDLGAEPS